MGVKTLIAELIAAEDAKTKATTETFFKEDIKAHGIKSVQVKQIHKRHLKALKGTPKKEMYDLCEQLWKTQYLEECIIACEWSQTVKKEFTPSDFATFERWIDTYVTNWATCDTFCTHTVGDFIGMYPEFVHELKRWALSENRWMRRAAAVSLIVPAKRGEFLQDIFEIADILFLDSDDMVQKGYGWMLKAATEKNTKEVFDYVIANRDTMPRTALRYAIEKMPKELKAEAMKKQKL